MRLFVNSNKHTFPPAITTAVPLANVGKFSKEVLFFLHIIYSRLMQNSCKEGHEG